MAHIVAAQAGNLNDTNTWVGGVAPGDGDTFESDYLVTVTSSVTIGDAPSPAATVIDITGAAGALRVLDGVTLTVKGEIVGADNDVTVEAGGEIDVVVGSGLEYQIRVAVTTGDTGRLKCNGVTGNRAKITGSGDGDLVIMPSTVAGVGNVDCVYTTFTNVGSASRRSIQMRNSVILNNCIFDGCGEVYNSGTLPATAEFNVSNCTFKNTPHARNFSLSILPVDDEEDRIFYHNSFDKTAHCSNVEGFEVTENFYADKWSWLDASKIKAKFSGNFVLDNNVRANATEIKNNYICKDTGTNPHLFLVSTSYDQVLDGCIFEFWGSDDEGDCINLEAPSSARESTIKNCIVLPNGSGLASGTLFSMLGGANVTLNAWNNTFYAKAGGSCSLAEAYGGHAGMLKKFVNNLAWVDSAGASQHLLNEIGTAANDYVTQADYNAGWNLTSYYDVDSAAFLTTPGVNDVANADPQFVDADRDLAKWINVVLGESGTEAELRTYARNAFANMNDEDSIYYHSGILPSDLVAWIKEGFAPQNSDLIGAGEGGTFIGAIEPVASGWSAGKLNGLEPADTVAVNEVAMADIATINGV